MRKLDLEEVKSFIEAQTPETKIYIGCDSERIKVNKVWYADYITAIAMVVNYLVKLSVKETTTKNKINLDID